MDLRWRWMLAGGMSLYGTLPPTPSTRSCARSRRRGPMKREMKDTAYRRSAIPTRVGSSTQHCWRNEAACFADHGLRVTGLRLGLCQERAGVLREDCPMRVLMLSNEL